MHRRSVLALGAAALAGCAADADSDAGPDTEAAEQAIIDGINEARREATVAELTPTDRLHQPAREHSRDMADRDFYRHVNPDGEDATDRAGCFAGENLHRGEIGQMQNHGSDETWRTTSADALAGFVVEGWKLSEEHYRNMIDGQFERVGVGVAIVDGEFFATAKFC